MSTHEYASHLSNIFDDPNTFQTVLDRTISFLHQLKEPFDYIACRGISGLAVSSPVSYLMKKRMIVVRKKNEKCASMLKVEGLPRTKSKDGFRYVIIDDFIFTGRTRDDINSALKQFGGKFVGLYQYNYDSWYRGDANG